MEVAADIAVVYKGWNLYQVIRDFKRILKIMSAGVFAKEITCQIRIYQQALQEALTRVEILNHFQVRSGSKTTDVLAAVVLGYDAEYGKLYPRKTQVSDGLSTS
ncbi:hypothetical protein BGX27_006832 [Mortierella sp. AM989]|nr:hypothetical protein BGX27_006832 [Mortierella sp. AM989]